MSTARFPNVTQHSSNMTQQHHLIIVNNSAQDAIVTCQLPPMNKTDDTGVITPGTTVSDIANDFTPVTQPATTHVALMKEKPKPIGKKRKLVNEPKQSKKQTFISKDASNVLDEFLKTSAIIVCMSKSTNDPLVIPLRAMYDNEQLQLKDQYKTFKQYKMALKLELDCIHVNTRSAFAHPVMKARTIVLYRSTWINLCERRGLDRMYEPSLHQLDDTSSMSTSIGLDRECVSSVGPPLQGSLDSIHTKSSGDLSHIAQLDLMYNMWSNPLNDVDMWLPSGNTWFEPSD
jgi:hypothetical protein